MNLRYVSLLQAVLSNRLLWLFLLVGFSALPALAQSTWTGATSTDWNTAGNWSGGTVPVVTDNVVIPPGPTNQPILSTSAVAKSVEVQSGASLSITAAGSLTINSSKNVSGFTTAFANRGNTWNAGQLVLGNTAAVGAGAIFNQGIFANAGGTIRVDRTSNQAINNNQGTFTNTGTIILGAVASVGSHGIFNLATFNNNNGEVRIDRSTEAGIRNQGSGASFTNSATITIGASFSAGARGLSNVNSATFSNNQGGMIQIDQTSQDGIQNAEGAVFTNSAMLVISSLFGVGVNGVFSNATFSNNGGGVIRIDRSTENGIRNQGSGASFTNSAQITLGSSFGVGASGIFNLGNATFRNNAGGRITIDRTLFAAITNDAPFVNSATITTGALFSTGAYGIFNTASFTNNDGEIKIDRSANAGIGNFRNTASFINSARITIGSSFGVGAAE